ncbi:hypothetical protein EV384_5316 [Micromonospora kangleipakensis]|uniref:Hsp20/alpha crystallin family protein n=1 Tax=Micromonospora kangleipakensis TaxID=1077942 RepID=A0A4Q8BFB3_9ACTN|nr:hypothetical protein EV384_5316 [Micromonospora kangleipakensis]
MPTGVMEKTIAARYADGMFEITAKVGDIMPGAKEIPIKVENGEKS